MAVRAGAARRVAQRDAVLRASSATRPTAWSKVLAETGTDRILGARIIGHSGEEPVHFFALAMKHGITAAQIQDMVFGFPTFSADIKSML